MPNVHPAPTWRQIRVQTSDFRYHFRSITPIRGMAMAMEKVISSEKILAQSHLRTRTRRRRHHHHNTNLEVRRPQAPWLPHFQSSSIHSVGFQQRMKKSSRRLGCYRAILLLMHLQTRLYHFIAPPRMATGCCSQFGSLCWSSNRKIRSGIRLTNQTMPRNPSKSRLIDSPVVAEKVQ